ncbi:MAG TPA: winged helix-turn-helix domain-containing protein [Gammaproteobacteria bacterium]|nr:winged helix-turn-helix domain-containing protein [Gammaproteobacteria bacterium]
MYRFDAFELDVAQRRLYKEGETVPLGRKAFDLLALLVESAGELKSRDELIEALWPRTVVQEQGLTTRIHELRKALGDEGEQPRYIETVRGIGYRFIGELAPERSSRPADVPHKPPFQTGVAVALLLLIAGGAMTLWQLGLRAPGRSSLQVPAQSVAVLPFRSVQRAGDVPSEQYFADGLSADLITALSQFEGVKVISRHSSFQFRGSTDSSRTIGKKLGVAHLLEGSVRRIGDKVRITAELVDAADGSTLWSQHYDRPYQDLFKLQDDITDAVANALKAKLLTRGGALIHTDRPPSGSLAAYKTYLHARSTFAHDTEADVRRAIALYREAIRLDPEYALAYAQLSRAWTALGATFLGGAKQRQAFDKARAASDRALHLDPKLAAAYTARGFTAAQKFDWNAAQVDFQRALRLAPEDGEAQFMLGRLSATLGQLDRAVALMRQALVTDPRNSLYYYMLSHYLAALGRLDNAEQAIRTAIALHPKGNSFHEQLAVVEILRGNAEEALQAAQKEPPGPWRDIALALAQQIGGGRAAADKALANLSAKYANIAAYQIADVYAARHESDAMFRWLDRAWSNRDPGVGEVLYDGLILRYRHDPRFDAFCRKIGLPVAKPIELNRGN